MHKKISLTIFSISLLIFFAFSGTDNAIKTNANSFCVDNLGNIYIAENDQLKKYDSLFKLTLDFSDKVIGTIDYVDAGNSMKPFIYSVTQGKITFLDNMLAKTSETLDVNQYCSSFCPVVCSSFNNSLWLFNYTQSELVRVDQFYNTLQRSGNLQQILGYKLNATCMIERGNYLYAADTARGIVMFDQFGGYYKTIGVKNARSFDVLGDVVYYINDKSVMTINIKTLEESTITSLTQTIKKIVVTNRKIYLQTDNEIAIINRP
jgi:hypothetical protein